MLTTANSQFLLATNALRFRRIQQNFQKEQLVAHGFAQPPIGCDIAANKGAPFQASLPTKTTHCTRHHEYQVESSRSAQSRWL